MTQKGILLIMTIGFLALIVGSATLHYRQGQIREKEIAQLKQQIEYIERQNVHLWENVNSYRKAAFYEGKDKDIKPWNELDYQIRYLPHSEWVGIKKMAEEDLSRLK